MVVRQGIVADTDEVRGGVSPTDQFSSIDDELTHQENLVLLGFACRPAEERVSCSMPLG